LRGCAPAIERSGEALTCQRERTPRTRCIHARKRCAPQLTSPAVIDSTHATNPRGRFAQGCSARKKGASVSGLLACVFCSMPELPAGEHYRSTPEFDETTMPAGLRARHTLTVATTRVGRQAVANAKM
jgi:hypothetical protein